MSLKIHQVRNGVIVEPHTNTQTEHSTLIRLYLLGNEWKIGKIAAGEKKGKM